MNSGNGEYMVEVEDLHKGFDGNQVLDGVTCQIPAGKISVVMGPSGTDRRDWLRQVLVVRSLTKAGVGLAGKHVPHLNKEELSELSANVGLPFQAATPFSL